MKESFERKKSGNKEEKWEENPENFLDVDTAGRDCLCDE